MLLQRKVIYTLLEWTLLKMFLYLGASFSLWTGGIASAVDGVAVLVCVAMNGFHSKVSYQWYSKAGVLNMAIHPVIYVESPCR